MVGRRAGWLVVAGCLAATSAAAAPAPPDEQHFDILCQGSETSLGHETHEETRLSIDLHFRVWCWRQSGCKETLEVRDVNAARLVLRNEHDGASDYDFGLERVGGAYLLRDIPKGMEALVRAGRQSRGTCAKAPFTPLPERAF